MIVRRRDEIVKGDRNVETQNFTSRRFLLKEDGMGFSLTETIAHEGTETKMWYKNHLEACYCIEGEGELQAVDSEAEIYQIRPGTLYALNKHDRHILRVRKRMRLVCVFNPPLTGREIHDADGSYPTSD